MEKDLLRLEEELTAAIAGLDSSQMQATPLANPEKWTVQQIVEHLLLTWQATIPGIQARIDKRSPTRTEPTLAQRVLQFRITRLGLFPSGMASPAAVSPSLPSSLRSGDALAARIHAELAELDQVTAEAERLFGGRKAMSHGVLGPLSLQQWRRFHLIHGLHHIRQIKAIRRDNRV